MSDTRALERIDDRLTTNAEGYSVFNTRDDYNEALRDPRMRTDREYARRVDEKFNRSRHLWDTQTPGSGRIQEDASGPRGSVLNAHEHTEGFRPKHMVLQLQTEREAPAVSADDAYTPNVLHVKTSTPAERKS